MQDVTLPLSEALGIWEAYNKVHDTSDFVFELGGRKCRSSYVDGVHTWHVPEKVRPELTTLLKATKAFEEQILSLQLDEREVSLLLSKYFRRNARTVIERRLIRRIASQVNFEDIKDAVLFPWVLEEELLKVMDALMIDLTGDMVETKMEEMDKEIH
jgi:hypothetical protein